MIAQGTLATPTWKPLRSGSDAGSSRYHSVAKTSPGATRSSPSKNGSTSLRPRNRSGIAPFSNAASIFPFW